jgi:hypothetical protein
MSAIGHDKQIERCDPLIMIADERSPALRWRASLLGHVLGDRGLPDLNAELK